MRARRPLALLLLLFALAGPAARADDRPAPPRRGEAPTLVTTGFDPRVDALPFGNNGDWASPGGNCWGMSLLAIDNYLRRRDGRPVDVASTDDPWDPIANDPVDLQTAGLAQQRASALDPGNVAPLGRLRDPSAIRAALERMATTGEPEVLLMRNGRDGHAVVLHGLRDGRLQVYDPNFPGETIEWPWDPVKGLGRHPRAAPDPKDFYAGLTEVGVTPFAQHRTSRQLAQLRAACAGGERACVGLYPSIRGGVTRRPDGSALVSGQVAPEVVRGEPTGRRRGALPESVWVVVDGQPVAQAPVRRGHRTFSVVVPPGVVTDASRVRLVGIHQGQFAGVQDLPREALRDAARPPPLPDGPRPASPPPRRPGPSRGLTGALEEGATR